MKISGAGLPGLCGGGYHRCGPVPRSAVIKQQGKWKRAYDIGLIVGRLGPCSRYLSSSFLDLLQLQDGATQFGVLSGFSNVG